MFGLVGSPAVLLCWSCDEGEAADLTDLLVCAVAVAAEESGTRCWPLVQCTQTWLSAWLGLLPMCVMLACLNGVCCTATSG